MFLIGFPLLVVPFAIYNMIAFLLPGLAWTQELTNVRLMSGADWAVTPGEVLVTFAIFVLFFEMLKSTRLAARSIVDHLLSVLLFVAMIVEFLLIRQAASVTFFLLMVISFVDVAGGIAIRGGSRAILVESAEPIQAV